MNTQGFDKCIELTFNNYGKVGVKAELLSAEDRQTDQNEWMRVVVEVTTLDKGLTRYAEEWRFGGVDSHERIQIPMGVRSIDRGRLIGAAKAVESLPVGFKVDRADCTLYWALSPSMSEPCYFFRLGELLFAVGAYTGHLRRE